MKTVMEKVIRTQMKNFSLILMPILIVGCATTTDIVPYGKDSFMLSSDDVWGGYSQGSLQVKAAQKASAYCAEKGKVFVVRNTAGQGLQGWTGTSSTLIFSCISENDPEYQRPNLRKEADTIIENRRN